MQRTVEVQLNKVCPTPVGLRAEPRVDAPSSRASANLGQRFLHYYFDSFPSGPPNPDVSRFEYLQLVSAAKDFKFHSHVANASTVKKRALSTEIGQAFCRWMLQEHFGIVYFAHLSDVIGGRTHAAFGGLRVERVKKGDIPDYLCARKVTNPLIAEAKGRFSPIGFENAEFGKWREQFERIRLVDASERAKRLKGYIVATQFVTESSASSKKTTVYVEDPVTEGEALSLDESVHVGRTTVAMHYGRVFRKIGLLLFASALTNGYSLTDDLRFQVPVWTCLSEPFQGRKYIGGYYRTGSGPGVTLTDQGWRQSLELGVGHSVFVGLELSVARTLAVAARGAWQQLDGLDPLGEVAPVGVWSSEFAWLHDGTVAAPAEYFVPTAVETL